MAIKWIGLKEFQTAINRNPQRVLSEVRLYLTRGLAEYKRGINRNPWGVGAVGGGVPVATGNLRDTHHTQVERFRASVGPDPFFKYAKFVHDGTRRMKARPWLDFVRESKDKDIQKHYDVMMNNIVRDLAR